MGLGVDGRPAEAAQDRPARGVDEDVIGAEGPMNHAEVMQVRQGGGERHLDPDRGRGERFGVHQPQRHCVALGTQHFHHTGVTGDRQDPGFVLQASRFLGRLGSLAKLARRSVDFDDHGCETIAVTCAS